MMSHSIGTWSRMPCGVGPWAKTPAMTTPAQIVQTTKVPTPISNPTTMHRSTTLALKLLPASLPPQHFKWLPTQSTSWPNYPLFMHSTKSRKKRENSSKCLLTFRKKIAHLRAEDISRSRTNPQRMLTKGKSLSKKFREWGRCGRPGRPRRPNKKASRLVYLFWSSHLRSQCAQKRETNKWLTRYNKECWSSECSKYDHWETQLFSNELKIRRN